MERMEHHQEPIISTIQKSSGTNGTISTERLKDIQEPNISNVQENNGTNGTNGVEQSFIINNNKNDNPFLDKDFL